MAKPTGKPNWTVGNPDFGTITVEPSNAKKEAGWFPDERPPREFLNWLFFIIGSWIDYFEEVTDGFSAQSIIYDAFVGAGGTHADINALMADPDIANLRNILIVSSIAVDNIQVVNQDGMTFDFKSQAGITKNGPTGAATGLQIDSNRVRINNGRFVGFSAAGNKGVDIIGNNNLVHGCMFNTCETAINDQGDANVYTTNIEEV